MSRVVTSIFGSTRRCYGVFDVDVSSINSNYDRNATTLMLYTSQWECTCTRDLNGVYTLK